MTDLAELAAPRHTAVVTQECQGAVMGPNARLAVLAKEARREALGNIVRLLPAARAAGVQVVHCLVHRRPDGLGANHNARIVAGGARGVDITPGSDGATLLLELGPEPRDIVAVGVSLNVAIPNLVMDAVNAAYRVVVPRDAVAGVPTEYGEAVVDNTLSLLATITTTDDLRKAWAS